MFMVKHTISGIWGFFPEKISLRFHWPNTISCCTSASILQPPSSFHSPSPLKDSPPACVTQEPRSKLTTGHEEDTRHPGTRQSRRRAWFHVNHPERERSHGVEHVTRDTLWPIRRTKFQSRLASPHSHHIHFLSFFVSFWVSLFTLHSSVLIPFHSNVVHPEETSPHCASAND